MKIKILFSIFATTLSVTFFFGCELDVINPNTPTEEQVLTTSEGLIAVAIGMQHRMAKSVDDPIIIPGLITRELSANSNSLANDREFQEGTIIEDNASINKLWSEAYQTIKSANDILSNIDAVQFSDGMYNNLVALAKLAKAIQFTILIQSGFQQIPIETYDIIEPEFVERSAVINHALGLLSDAASKATLVSDEFNEDVLGDSFDLINTIKAFQARLSLMKGSYKDALAFANSVNYGAVSHLVYDNSYKNPLTDSFNTRNMFGVPQNWRENAEPADTRLSLLFATESYDGGVDWPDANANTLYQLIFWDNETDPYELFRYNEMILIVAEANARNGNLNEAITAINVIRNMAGLVDFSNNNESEILEEILNQRQYELFATGVSLEDYRRFGKINEIIVAWLPYPVSERDSNSNTPENP